MAGVIPFFRDTQKNGWYEKVFDGVSDEEVFRVGFYKRTSVVDLTGFALMCLSKK